MNWNKLILAWKSYYFGKEPKEKHMKGAWRYKKDGITKEFLE